MSTAMLASYVLLWLLVAALTVLILLLYRQYGLMVLPAKARLQLAGLDIGSRAPQVEVVAPDGARRPLPVTAGDPAEPDRPLLQVLLFTSTTCPICNRLWGEVGALPDERPEVDYWWVDSGVAEDEVAPRGWTVVRSDDRAAHDAMQVPALPYAYALDGAGIVRAKGLMNDLDDFRQLISMAVDNLPRADGSRELLQIATSPSREDT